MMLAQIEAEEKSLRAELESRRRQMELDLEKRVKEISLDNEHFQKLVAERKKELYRLHTELQSQIYLVESKVRPDEIWVEAFTAGFSKAWDMMMPLMMEGIGKSKETIRSLAIEETRKRLEPLIRNGR